MSNDTAASSFPLTHNNVLKLIRGLRRNPFRRTRNMPVSPAFSDEMFGAQDAAYVPLIARHLNDRRSHVRLWAVRALANIGPPAAPAARAIARRLAHERVEEIRLCATYAIRQIAPPLEEVLPALTAALRDSGPLVRGSAAAAIAELGSSPDTGLLPLIRLLADADPKARWAAASGMGNLGKWQAFCHPVLVRQLAVEQDTDARASILQALGKLGVEPARTTEFLVTALRDCRQHPHVRWAAIRGLGELGPQAEAAVPTLEFLNNPSFMFEDACAGALVRIRGSAA